MISVWFLSEDSPVWPGEQGFESEQLKFYEKDGCNVSSFKMGMHMGTHVDAPIHFTRNGIDIADVPMEKCMGAAKVFAFDEQTALGSVHFEGLPIYEGDIILLNMKKNNILLKDTVFRTDYVYVGEDAARYLADKKVAAVGVNYFSVAQCTPSDKPTSHNILLENNIIIYEGLNLEGIEPGEYTIFCLPIKIKGGNGSPARAILIR